MIRLTRKLDPSGDHRASSTTLTLPWEQRTRSRMRVVLDDGREAGLFMERGTVLRTGDRLCSDQGDVVEVRAAAETLSVVGCDDALLMARVCYHLGNRHVQLHIAPRQISYLKDPVLDAMVQRLGLTALTVHALFEPELGAYAHEGHTHE